MTRESAADTRAGPTRPVTERLLGATESLLAQKGIRATTVAQVAESAGVSRAWLYRHFPDKQALIGAAIVRLTEAFWVSARMRLDDIDDLAGRICAGVHIGRGAYDDPGTLLIRLRTTEPEDFNACAGVGVAGLIPDLAVFWQPYVDAGFAAGQIHPAHDRVEVAEWVARILISLGTMAGTCIDPDDPESVRRHIHRYVMPGLITAPST